MIEVGWTVWDIEVELYLEAIRQMRRSKNQEDFMHIHLTYVPVPWWVDEQKTKPTQQSINLLQSKWLFPDVVIARGSQALTAGSRSKIALFSNLSEEKVFSIPDLDSIYNIPDALEAQGFDKFMAAKLAIEYPKSSKIELWRTELGKQKLWKVRVAIIGKYVALEDSYSSIIEALGHAWQSLWVEVEVQFIDARVTNGIEDLKKVDACIVAWGFGDTGIENMLDSLQYMRENKIPCLWICLGMQLMMVEFARNVLMLPQANSLEFDADCKPFDIVTLLEEQKKVVNLGWTMRLWKHTSVLDESQSLKLYTKMGRTQQWNKVHERFRHRFEINPIFAEQIHDAWLGVVGKSVTDSIVQFIEMDVDIHPYYLGTQAHPELTSKLENVSPLFYGLLQQAIK